jgi:phospholipid/cholesterol/gamma-HCH transport system substrate-binding protein
METNVNYTMAGTFVLVLLTLIILGVIWLSAGISTEKFSYYQVDMKESIAGLAKDGLVKFNGVDVGTVDQMKINKKDLQIVELILKIKSDTPVSVGTTAKLGMQALTGVAYILLEDKGNDKQPLLAKNGQLYPIIPTIPSVLVRLDATLTQIDISFRDVSTSIKSLLNNQNLQLLRKILINIDRKTS